MYIGRFVDIFEVKFWLNSSCLFWFCIGSITSRMGVRMSLRWQIQAGPKVGHVMIS